MGARDMAGAVTDRTEQDVVKRSVADLSLLHQSILNVLSRPLEDLGCRERWGGGWRGRPVAGASWGPCTATGLHVSPGTAPQMPGHSERPLDTM